MLSDSEFNQEDFEESESESDFKASPDVELIDETQISGCDFDSLLEQMTSLILSVERNPLSQLKKRNSPLSIQIIPNVNRIRIEKRRAVAAIKERKSSL